MAMSRRESTKSPAAATRSKSQAKKKPNRKTKSTKALKQKSSLAPIPSPRSRASSTSSEDAEILLFLSLMQPIKHIELKNKSANSKSSSCTSTPFASPSIPGRYRSPCSSDDEIFSKIRINQPSVKWGKKKPKSPDTVEIFEYYPHKLKRPTPEKRIMLKHKYNLKPIIQMNKRKAMCPRKENNSIETYEGPEVDYSELSAPEVRVLDDSVEIDSDEELRALSSFSSPVWWEDPPDDTYDEGPIDRSVIEAARELDSPMPLEEDIHLRCNEIHRSNEKFLHKKSKLEHILGNIKSLKEATTEERTEAAMKRVPRSSESSILSDMSGNECQFLEEIVIPVEDSSSLPEMDE